MTESYEKTAPKQSKFGAPGQFAYFRAVVGGDWRAALLLYRVEWRWRMHKKIKRKFAGDIERNWVAMSRQNWARESGLGWSEFKNYALPVLKHCDFVQVRQARIRPHMEKMVFISLEPSLMPNPVDIDWEHWDWKWGGGLVLGAEPTYKALKN